MDGEGGEGERDRLKKAAGWTEKEAEGGRETALRRRQDGRRRRRGGEGRG